MLRRVRWPVVSGRYKAASCAPRCWKRCSKKPCPCPCVMCINHETQWLNIKKKKRLKPMCQPHLKNISWEIIVNQVHQCSLFFYITIIHQSFSLFLQTCPPRKSTFTPGFRKSNQRCRHCRAAAAGTIFHLGSGSRTQNLEMPGIYGILRLNDYWPPNLGGWLFWMI